MDRTGRFRPRNFQYFPLTEFQLVVLHPDQLLPRGSTLLRRNSDSSYTAYKASSDKLLRQVDPAFVLSSNNPSVTAPSFPPFLHQTTRSLPQSLNIYFVLLNAEIKFQRFAKHIGLDKLHPDVKAIVDQTIEIVHLMYSEPRSEAAAHGEWSMRMRPQGHAEEINYEDEGRMETGGAGGATSDATVPMEDLKPEPRTSTPLQT
jgi:hypothetical protein